MDITTIVDDFAHGLELADSRRPQAASARSGLLYQLGIGPHTEARTVQLVLDELVSQYPQRYAAHARGVAYGDGSRQACDLCFGRPDSWDWAIEVKMIRMLGDNGKPNDNLPTHVLSPYPQHRSALTDCEKLVHAQIGRQKAILIYGYEYPDWPLDPLVAAFEHLASERVTLGQRHTAAFEGLIHPVHQRGAVMGWKLSSQ